MSDLRNLFMEIDDLPRKSKLVLLGYLIQQLRPSIQEIADASGQLHRTVSEWMPLRHAYHDPERTAMSSHPTHKMHENSLECYRSLNLAPTKLAVLAVYHEFGPMTDRQIGMKLGMVDLNGCKPVITTLIDKDKLLVEIGKQKCEVTGRKVRIVDLVSNYGGT